MVANVTLQRVQDLTLSDGTPAAFWAVYVYMPTILFDLAIAFITVLIPAWEYIMGMRNELGIWRRVIRRQRGAPRLLLPMAISILLLRYLTLAFFVSWTMVYAGHHWSSAQCSILWPFCIVCTTALCWCTSVALTVRAALYFPTAIQSKRTLLVVRVLLSLFLAAHLVAFLTTWALTGDILNRSMSIYGTCANGSVGRYASDHKIEGSAILQSKSLLLLNFGCSLMLDCIVTFFACWVFRRIRRQGPRTASLVSIFLTNTILYFIAVVLLAIFGIVWFVRKDPSIGVLNLYTSLAAVLAIRMLSAEFAFMAGGASSHARCDADPLPPDYPFGVGEGVAGAGKEGGRAERKVQEQQTYLPGEQVDFRRGGLTDIEALSAAVHGRSLGRPEPVWLDDLASSHGEREITNRVASVVHQRTIAQINTS
ncbi:unnamed protein product [Tilletia laevis]|uniref:Uncharacterized protein n=2 Tax=Tilletia TaxID=13289 RepID=A0A177V3T7_9BASI|nr:hypothetical protein CF336_g4406 [Tilletia laevis]KAE8260593.1 hypothetical protein A4X03_0g3767 [Tilletia caries]KAE8201995.1 hypothetical protein CF335_g3583 [Tilletia laevis]CAD6887255.1 unnamed protein product [Tilletia caries]CAD6918897.1 unnamed protein product [Tilletia laevis]